MSTFSERLEGAKNAVKPSRDVVVSLDADVSERRAELRELLAKARANPDARMAARSEPELIQEQLDELLELTAESLVTLRFTRMSGVAWAEVTARCPVRLDAAIDRQYGYNVHAVCALAAPLSGVRVDGDDVVPLIVSAASQGTPAVNEWADLFDTISGHEFGLIVDAIYELNEYEPASRVAQLKKEQATHSA
jgi:hypothetical protein